MPKHNIYNLFSALWRGHSTFAQFFRFGLVGAAGFVVDAGVLTGCVDWGGLDRYSGRAVSFLAAVTTTWFLNRVFTFRRSGWHKSHREWAKFVVVNSAGFVVNYGAYAALIATQPYVHAHPWTGVAAGSLAGMLVNFFASKKMVFK